MDHIKYSIKCKSYAEYAHQCVFFQDQRSGPSFASRTRCQHCQVHAKVQSKDLQIDKNLVHWFACAGISITAFQVCTPPSRLIDVLRTVKRLWNIWNIKKHSCFYFFCSIYHYCYWDRPCIAIIFFSTAIMVSISFLFVLSLSLL